VETHPLPCWGLPDPVTSEPGPALNRAQQGAVDRIITKLGQNARFLLYGITGSGKTEVFIQAIRENRSAGRQTLLLVPEIGLTPQLIQRLRQRLGGAMALLHSGLNDSERHCHWEMARQGEADIIVGTRSAVFTPIPRLGLVIVDEEHDASLKQQDGFRYHARDLAIMRAGQLGIPILLASATPSTESLAHTETGHYELLELSERAGAAKPPEMSLVDLRRDSGDDGISSALLNRAQQHLKRGGQVMFFINRRGFAPTLLCDACGWVAQCTRCDARMTLHERANRLRCHHCGHEERPPESCNNCGSTELIPLGQGTERIEQAIARHFPDTPITRIDRDSTRRKGALEEGLEKARSGEARILIGTQMLAKGHDFPGLTLVGVMDSDQGLFSADFRAAERMAQLILQVSGRAGRSDQPGEVIIQTRHPDHPLLQSLIHQDYRHFAQGLLAERKAANLPPYSFLSLLRVEATDKKAPPAFIEKLLSALPRVNSASCMGPIPAPMEKRAGRFRYQMLIQSNNRKALHRQLDILLRQLEEIPESRTVRWSLDVDPVELY
jgi:primosomal protein N' (replication factor Y)